jgi:hypothetical protein
MATYKPNSWGRTRTPKNILSGFRAGTNANGDGLAVNSATSDGFVTENQRYLIIQLTAYNTSFKVQGYMHASDTWSDLKGGPTINAVGIWIVEIHGIDKVRFVTGVNTTLFAACSTF